MPSVGDLGVRKLESTTSMNKTTGFKYATGRGENIDTST